MERLARELKAHVTRASAEFGVAVDEEAAQALVGYVMLVREWNERVNLTAARDGDALFDVLLLDALVLAKEAVTPRAAHVADVGAGVGAPSLPLAMIRPDVRCTLIEPRRKRVAFLRSAVGRLGFETRIRVVEGRVDSRHSQIAGAPFEMALSRATFSPPEWLRIGAMIAQRVVVLTSGNAAPAPHPGFEQSFHASYATTRDTTRTVACYDRMAT